VTKPVATPPPPVPPPTAATRIFVRLFGKAGHRSVERHPMLDLKLQRARNPLVPSAYLAALYGHVTLAVLVGLLPLVLYVVLTAGAVNINLAVPLAALPAIMGLMTYSYDLLKPDLQIAARKRNLETNLPYALNFMASMASAGVIPIEIFGALYGQGVLGHGMLFGLAGEATRPEAAMIGFVLATVTIVSAVGLMMVRETRWFSAAIVLSSVVGTLVAGQMFGYGAALAFIGALVATRIDRTAPLT